MNSRNSALFSNGYSQCATSAPSLYSHPIGKFPTTAHLTGELGLMPLLINPFLLLSLLAGKKTATITLTLP